MDYIYYAFNMLIVIVIVIINVKIFMSVANYVGERIGIGKFLMYLFGKLRKK